MIAAPGRAALDLEPAADAQLRLHDLGPLGVEVGGIATPIPGVKPSRILATLLVNANRRVSIDTLVDAVWGERVFDTAVTTLESHIWRLRKVMEPHRARRAEPTYLISDTGGYRLIVNPDNADSLRFTQLAEQGDRLLASGEPDRALRRYELALTLWRGRPFDPVADLEWTVAPIARLEELYGQLNEQRVEALLRTGAVDRAIRELEGLTGRLPYRERLWSQLMLGLYRAGRVEEALAAYGRARDVLLDTLGLEPGSELRALQQRILDQDPALSPSPPESAPIQRAARGPGEVHLPARLSELVGRAGELERLTELLKRSRLVTLVGAAGCGKTRLAIEVARSMAGGASDGVWFVDLTAVDDPVAVADLVMSTIGVAQPPVGTALTALRSYVRDRRVLLLIDNCEHVLPAVRQLLDALLADDGECRILATSREPVGVDGEVLWTLPPLAVRSEAGATVDDLSPAAQLFISRARSTEPRFEPSPAELEEVEAICAAVDGIPLAIELAAGRIRSASLAEVRQQVTAELSGLSRIGYTRIEHHRTVELSIEWSVRLLSPAERIVHGRLSALPGVFTVEAARAVAGVAPVAAPDLPDLLSQLVHRSLLTVVPGGSAGQPTRFRQLATVRAHAAHALSTSGESDEARDRMNTFAVELTGVRPPFGTEDRHGWYATAELNHDTLAAVLQDTIQDRPDSRGVRMISELGAYWFYRRRTAEGARWARAALEHTEASAGYRGLVELTLAYLLALRDRTDLALPLVRSALAHPDATGDPRAFGRALFAPAWCAFLRGDPALDFVGAEVRRLAGDDAVLDVSADVLETASRLAKVGPVIAGARAGEIIDRAMRIGNVQAAWYAAGLAIICAASTGDVAQGAIRLRQFADFQRRAGGSVTTNVIEFEANFAAIAGDHERAAQLYGQASALAFRAGTLWPMATATEPILARVRRALPTERFDAAWQVGEAQAQIDDR